MKTILQSIFSGDMNANVHNEFIKFSKGVFKDRYLVEAKKQKDAWSIKTSAEYANQLVRACLIKAKGQVEVTGVITATFNVQDKSQFPIEEVKNAMGIKKAVVNTKTEPSKIIALMDAYPKAFFALSFTTPETTLKIKAKAPKSAKPASGGDKEPKAEFCTIKTNDKEIVDSLLFGCPEVKELAIKHYIEIKDIVLPKGLTDPVQIREQAKRKGTVKRIVLISEKQTITESDFFA